MFQFPWLPSAAYGFSGRYHPIKGGGFPHSDIPGSQLAYSSPRRIGVRPVLHRLLAPRHPPCALSSLSLRCFQKLARSYPAFFFPIRFSRCKMRAKAHLKELFALSKLNPSA